MIFKCLTVSVHVQVIQLNTFDHGSWWSNEDTRNDDFYGCSNVGEALTVKVLMLLSTIHQNISPTYFTTAIFICFSCFNPRHIQHASDCMRHFVSHQLKSTMDEQKYLLFSQINDSFIAPKTNSKVKNIVCLDYRSGGIFIS